MATPVTRTSCGRRAAVTCVCVQRGHARHAVDRPALSVSGGRHGCAGRGVRIVRRIFAQPALAEAGGKELLTDDFGPDDSNEEAIRAFVRSHADSVYHPAGTCKMGVDAMAVVDPSLRVRGLTVCAWLTRRSCRR